ncbi:GyrI-like domain-containing protein [Microbacterium sp. CJ77]|uniref:GyrI-like domain-containing protein n=1 Tax=Microbacterium sp. CJ77 TaxID=2079201 RepID=UPI000CD97840|nr:GyrI-like domain-containing protein [Microbacterium sp. CJ77]
MKVDLKKQIATYVAPHGRFDIVTVPPMRYVAVDGMGDPNTAQSYADALATLYHVAYALKFLSKRELDRDYVVMPLEALWWSDDMAAFTVARDKTRWRWTAMILVPGWIDDARVEVAVQGVRTKGGAPAIEELRVLALDEGLCVQTLHVGPYDAEGPVLEAMHDDFIPANGLRMTGRHHEIYLGDPRRTAPEKLRTILRQPVERIG